MSYQVLARKWRPQTFAEVIGQEHVTRALTNALQSQRLHHAYLFSGTRGVGKTSLARILARCLNCEQSITATPCGECGNCTAIRQGNFADLIEIDAASRTRVEETRELLDTVQYLPSQGRYKIYLIDEVHMLSGHSFNALLKTLEEPPEHVKFFLATTDPHKLPITILSRCLQFHLKALSKTFIEQQLAHILQQEQIAFNSAALATLSHAANGSMRDALSLLDQAIAYGAGKIDPDDVNRMLGTLPAEPLLALLQALANRNTVQLYQGIQHLVDLALDFNQALESLLSLLHQVAITQLAPHALDANNNQQSAVATLAKQFSPEAVQLYYQIALTGRRDLPLAPTAQIGFEMVMLRLFAFQIAAPVQLSELNNQHIQSANTRSATQTTTKAATKPITTVSTTAPETAQVAATAPIEPTKPHSVATTTTQLQASPPAHEKNSALFAPSAWADIIPQLSLSGLTATLAQHCCVVNLSHNHIALCLAAQHAALCNDKQQQRLQAALEQHFKRKLQVSISIEELTAATPAQQQAEQQAKQLASAKASIENDSIVQTIVAAFDGKIIPNSIQALATG